MIICNFFNHLLCISSHFQVLCNIEVHTGTEVKTLYSNISLIDNIVKLGDYVKDSNQIIGENFNPWAENTAAVRLYGGNLPK